MNACQTLPDLDKVARSFGRAARDYDRYARLQRDVADQLVAEVAVDSPRAILDAGSGTGYCARLLRPRFPSALLVSLDIAAPMLAYARKDIPDKDQAWICSDVQILPFADASFDLVVSSLTLQWCSHPEQFFAELFRVMKPGARAWISTLATDTLKELRDSWAEVDDYVHVNRFLSANAIAAATQGARFARVVMSNRQDCYYYDSLSALARELKGIGANNRNRQQAGGLTGKRKLQQLKTSFESRAIPGKGIPVTYDLVTITLEK